MPKVKTFTDSFGNTESHTGHSALGPNPPIQRPMEHASEYMQPMPQPFHRYGVQKPENTDKKKPEPTSGYSNFVDSSEFLRHWHGPNALIKRPV